MVNIKVFFKGVFNIKEHLQVLKVLKNEVSGHFTVLKDNNIIIIVKD